MTAPRQPNEVCIVCGLEYALADLHYEVCPAYTCDYCGTTHKEVLELDAQGERICEDCAAELAIEAEAIGGN